MQFLHTVKHVLARQVTTNSLREASSCVSFHMYRSIILWATKQRSQTRKLCISRKSSSYHYHKGQATLCVQSPQYRTRSSEIAFLRTVLVKLSTCIPYQLNVVSDYAIAQYRTNASDIAHFVRIV